MNMLSRTLILCSVLCVLSSIAISGQEADCSEYSGYRMDIYSGENRIGHSNTSFERVDESTVVSSDSVMNITVMGKTGTVKIDSEYTVVNNEIKEFSYKLVSDSGGMELDGTRVNDGFVIKNKDRTRKAPLPAGEKKYILPALLPQALMSKGLETGKNYSFYIFDPVTFYTGGDIDKLKVDISVGELEEVNTPAGEYNAYRINMQFLGADSYLWITPEGLKVKEYAPPGFTFYLSKAGHEQRIPLSSLDITEKTAISLSDGINNPEDLKRLRVRIGGMDSLEGLDLHDGYRQFLRGNHLEVVTTESVQGPFQQAAGGDGETDHYLRGSSLINVSDTKIVEKVREITDGETDNERKVRLINSWVFDNMKKEPRMSIPDSSEVLEGMKGDCNEHTVLFTALARASGIPAKVVMGLVYLEGRFHYHAWSEVFTDRWIAVDPTLGQYPADATHIKILEGDISRSPEIIKVVGRMKLDVIYYE